MTPHPTTHERPGLRAIILAAGKDAITPDGRPLILQPLGDRSVLEHVIQNALQLVPIEQLSVVVGYRQTSELFRQEETTESLENPTVVFHPISTMVGSGFGGA